MKKNKYFLLNLFFIIFLVALLSFGRALFFHFSFDDWGLLWLSKYDLPKYFRVFTYHPLVFIAFYPWVYIFGASPILYNILGLILKIAAAFTFGLVFYKISNSKKVFFSTALIYASTHMGLEGYTFISARVTAIMIILTNLVLLILISKKYYFVLGILLLIGFWGDPAKVAFLVPMIIIFLWSRYLIKRDKFKYYLFLSFYILLATFGGIMSSSFGRSLLLPNQGVQESLVTQVNSGENYYLNFFKSIGLIYGSYLSIDGDFSHVITFLFKNPENFAYLVTILLIIFNILIFIVPISRKHFPLLSAFSSSIYIAYFPNWAVFPYMHSFTNHRYQALSTLMYLFLICYIGIFFIRNKYAKVFLLSFIVTSGVFKSIKINSIEAAYRDYNKVQKIYNTQNRSIKGLDYGNMLFINTGNSILLGNQIHWSAGGTVAFALERKINKLGDIPSFTRDIEQAAKLVCIDSQLHSVLGETILKDRKVEIHNVYSWEIFDGGHAIDKSEETRELILNSEVCKSNEKSR